MFESILAVTTLDYVVIGILALAVILGLLRGWKSVLRGLSTFCIIVLCALLAANALYPKLTEGKIGDTVTEKVDEWVVGWEEDWTIVLTRPMDTTSSETEVYILNENDEWVTLSEAINPDKKDWAIYLAMFARMVYPEATREAPSQPLADALAATLTNIIVVFMLFLIFAIVFWIVIAIFRHIYGKKIEMMGQGKPVIDRILGAVWSLAGVAGLLFVILAGMSFIPNVGELGFIKDSTILKFLFEKNPLRDMISNLFAFKIG